MSTDLQPMQAAPKELTAEEAQERAEKCYEIETEIKTGLRAGRSAMWQVAKGLYEFHEENGHSALGYETLGEWLAQPDVSMSRRAYNLLIAAYRETAVRKQIPMAQLEELDHSKVQVVVGRVASGKVTVEEALDDAKELGIRDLRQKYFDRKPPEIGADDEKPVSDDIEDPVWEDVDEGATEPAHNDLGPLSEDEDGNLPEDDWSTAVVDFLQKMRVKYGRNRRMAAAELDEIDRLLSLAP